MKNHHKAISLRTKITSLEKIYFGWVEYFRPEKVPKTHSKYKEYTDKVYYFENDHIGFLSNVAHDKIGTFEGSSAANAVKIYERIQVLNEELEALHLESEVSIPEMMYGLSDEDIMLVRSFQ